MKPKKSGFYPRADENKQPSAWWYYGRAIYVSRRDYKKIFFQFLTAGVPLGAIGVLLQNRFFKRATQTLAGSGFFLLFYSLFGLYRQYGPPARNYFAKLLEQAEVKGAVTLADIHIGTYRHSYQFANLLPQATVFSIDCWQDGSSAEEAIADVRSLEPAPVHEPRLKPLKAPDFEIPLESACCDVIVFGFGTHEIPEGAPRDKIFAEALRILKPGGKALLFEHGIDFHNFLIFGPVIKHVTHHNEWMQVMRASFTEVREGRMYAVDMITGVKPIGEAPIDGALADGER